MTELHGSHAASCLASQAGAQATNPMEGMVITTSRLGLWPEGPRTDRYGHAEYEFSYRVHRRNVTRLDSESLSVITRAPPLYVALYVLASLVLSGQT